MFCDRITGDYAVSHGMCPEHTIAYLMDQMKLSPEQAVAFVKSKLEKEPNYFVPNTSGAKATDPLTYPETMNTAVVTKPSQKLSTP